jgi:hypothetical protein
MFMARSTFCTAADCRLSGMMLPVSIMRRSLGDGGGTPSNSKPPPCTSFPEVVASTELRAADRRLSDASRPPSSPVTELRAVDDRGVVLLRGLRWVLLLLLSRPRREEASLVEALGE